MPENFMEALGDLLAEWAEKADREEMISALELQLMALNEESE